MNVKNLRKYSLVAIVGLAAMGLTGCTKVTPESLLNDAAKKMKDAESYAMNMKMDMAAGGSMMGVTLDLTMNLDMKVDVDAKNEMSHGTGIVDMSFLGESNKVDTETYSFKENDKTVTYTKSGDVWEKIETEEDLIDAYGFGDVEKLKNDLVLSDKTVDVDGKECYELKGELSGEALETLMDSLLSSMDNGKMFGDDADWADVKIPVEYYITKKDRYPLKATIKMQEMMDKLLQGVDQEDVEFACEKCEVEISFDSFNKVGSITIPEDVKKAAEEGAAESEALSSELDVKDLEALLGSNDTEAETKKDGDPESESAQEPNVEQGEAASLDGKYTMTMKGKNLTFPCTYAEMIEMGLVLDSKYSEVDEEYMINKNDYTFGYMVEEGKDSMGSTVYFYNETDKPKNITEASVGGMDISGYDFEEDVLEGISFSGSLKLGDSKEAAFALYGDPTERYETKDFSTYTWREEDSYYKSIRISVDEEQKITGVEMKNMNLTF